MLSLSNLFCDHAAGNERLRYGHRHGGRERRFDDRPYPDAPRPVVVWAVTGKCNLRCVHCYAGATDAAMPGELTTAEGFDLLDQLKAFGCPAVLISGGEPLSRPDTLEFIAYAAELGLPCTLSTNGTLITPWIAQRLAALGLRYVGVSLDGSPATHDKLRGAKGAFHDAVAGIRRCKAAGLKVGVRFTVHGLNRHEIDDVIDTCLAEGIDRLCVYHLAYAGRGGKMQKLDLTAEDTRDVVDHLIDRTRRCHAAGEPLEVLTVGNHADAAYAVLRLEAEDSHRAAAVHAKLTGTGGNRSGQNICSIDPIGRVHMDQFSWHHSVGDLRKETFAEIWGGASDLRLRTLRARPKGLPEACRTCRFVGLCNGNLRTRAEAATGDWLGMDPSCYLTEAERAASTSSAIEDRLTVLT